MRRLLTTAFALVIATSALAAEETIRKGFNVAEGGTLRLHADAGRITIVSGGSGVAVEIVRSASGGRATERMNAHRIDFRQNGNDVVIEDDLPNEWSIFGRNDGYDVRWNIRVPARYNVDVRTSGGGIDLADIGGSVDARTSGGGIKTGRIAGPGTLRTSGGSIRVAGAGADLHAHTSGGSIEIGDTAGRLEARTSGGSIRLSRIGGDVVARTSGGGIRIEDAAGAIDASTSGGSIQATLSRQPQGDSRLATSGGSVTVSLAGGLSFELDARASGGAVRSDVPVTVHGRLDEDSLQGQIGRGGPKLVLRSSGGGVRVRPL